MVPGGAAAPPTTTRTTRKASSRGDRLPAARRLLAARVPDGAPLGTTAIALLLAGGFAAGVVNSMAGGGSLLTVPLLVTLGLPGTTANATNRIAVLVQSIVGAWRFRAEGVPGVRGATHALVPLLIGAAAGALLVSWLPHETFERLFGVVMVALLVPLLRAREIGAAAAAARPWPPALTTLAFLAIGVYGGAIQAGVGISCCSSSSGPATA